MSNIKNEKHRIGQKEGMISYLKIQETGQTTKHCKDEVGKKQLAHSKKSPEQVRGIDKILKKEHMESCLKLLKFVADSKLTLTQVNGQRKLGPPPGWTGPPPGPKCEIFVGNIPRNYYEPELVMIFRTVGQIYELRLMMDFSGTNRGFCFVMYTTEEEAARAVRELDQYETYPGKRIGVVASTNNCRLYIKQLPQNVDSKAIVQRIYEITDDVDKVAIYRRLDGIIAYVLVSYKTHRGAAMGRRRLVPEAATLFQNCEVNVEWANPNMFPSNVNNDIDHLWSHVKMERGYFPLSTSLRKWHCDLCELKALHVRLEHKLFCEIRRSHFYIYILINFRQKLVLSVKDANNHFI